MSVAKISRVVFALTLALLLTTVTLAQDAQSKVDIFAGYSWEAPGRIGVPVRSCTAPDICTSQVIPGGPTVKVKGGNGFGTSVTFNLKKYVGLTADFSNHWADEANSYHLLGGPKLFYRGEHITPFAEALFGVTHQTPHLSKNVTGLGIAIGGGLDLDVNKHFAWRVIQADWMRQQFSSNAGLGVGHMNGARLQSGVVFKLGGAPPIPPTATCSAAQPAAVQAGEPISVTINPAGFNPKHTVTYDWKSTGGKVTGKETTASIDTTGLAPGNYTVTGTATDAKQKQNNVASCTSSFTVNEPPKHPPVMSCSAAPTTVTSGETSTITAQASSPDNRPLTYTWNATAGRVSGTGASVTLETAGAPAAPITVNGVVTDDRGLTANCSTTVGVQAPPPPPPPPAPEPGSAAAIRQELQEKGRTLLPVHFDTAKATIRIDSEQLLNNAAQVLREDPNLFVFVDGYTDNVGGKAYNLDLSRRRAAAVRAWLVKHGIEANRLAARGFGMSNPVGDNTTDEGRQMNRRVELVTMNEAEKTKAQKPAPKARRKQ